MGAARGPGGVGGKVGEGSAMFQTPGAVSSGAGVRAWGVPGSRKKPGGERAAGGGGAGKSVKTRAS